MCEQAGFYMAPSTTQTQCGQCPNGTYSGVAAVDCIVCPVEKRYTHSVLNTGEDDCHPCPKEHYVDGSGCKACRGACTEPNYESVACTSATDRTCLTCYQECGTGTEPVSCPSKQSNPSYGCAACNSTQKPPNSYYTPSLEHCTWQCNAGFFNTIDPQVRRTPPTLRCVVN
jgi:hypothetical protein